ncbi:MAG: ATP synthase F1 subunit epsilon [Lachnospiraceae bacterium]|nr:ATP synthase F1 subunit epsilon [Lachnospiraceae bacterium]
MAEKFKLTIVTPDREFFNEEADMVEFNTTEGEIGVYASHAPLTVIVKPGILTITQGETVKNAALHAGFVQILPQEITILAEIIEWPGEIDETRANAAKQRAEERLADHGSNIDIARAEAALMRSIARINAAKLK